jgi:hypothetical protein
MELIGWISRQQGCKAMKATVFGVFGGAVLVGMFWLVSSGSLPLFAQRVSAYEPAGELIAVPTTIEGGRIQQVTVIDPRTRVMNVYHVELSSGAITLKSVRNIHWDLQMIEFNGVKPLPAEIRGLLDTR